MHTRTYVISPSLLLLLLLLSGTFGSSSPSSSSSSWLLLLLLLLLSLYYYYIHTVRRRQTHREREREQGLSQWGELRESARVSAATAAAVGRPQTVLPNRSGPCEKVPIINPRPSVSFSFFFYFNCIKLCPPPMAGGFDNWQIFHPPQQSPQLCWRTFKMTMSFDLGYFFFEEEKKEEKLLMYLNL